MSNPESESTDLFIFVDGPKTQAERSHVNEVISVATNVDGFRSVTLSTSSVNLGLSGSIVSGLDKMLAEHDRLIVIEDDIVVAPGFLKYMNDSLGEYASDSNVASIHGYCYPVKTVLPRLFFIRGADCWGWGTWARAWTEFNPSGQSLLDRLTSTGQLLDFDLGGSAPYSKLLKGQISGANDSWAIRWHASAFLANMLTLYPGQTLVQNIGLDGSGTHSGVSRAFRSSMSLEPIGGVRIPIVESAQARQAFADYFAQRESATRLIGRLARRTKRGVN